MSAIGYPDYQRITQWLGSPLVTHDALVIGLGPHVDGPLEVANFAAIVVALKATGGNVTVTVKQTIQGGPAAVVLSQQVVVAAGATLFEAFVLFGTAVEIDLAGSVVGTSVDYALYGSNTTTNAQVITAATINVQHNEVLVAAEPTLDIVDATAGQLVFDVTDDAPNTRVKLTPRVVGVIAYSTRKAVVTTAGATYGTGADVLAADLGFTADGTSDYVIEVTAAVWDNGGGNNNLALKLDGAEQGIMAQDSVPGGAKKVSARATLTAPAAGAHTVNARLFVGAGTANLYGGDGTAANYHPILVTITRLTR